MYYFLLFALILVVFYLLYSHLQDAKIAKKNIESSKLFLANNLQNEDVMQTASGLQYRFINTIDSGDKPTKQSRVTCHYHGKLVSGHVFDSSVQRDKPISFKLNQVIAGWTEVLQLMKAGEKVEAYIPSNLAYGNRRVGKIPAGSLLIFTIELLEIEN